MFLKLVFCFCFFKNKQTKKMEDRGDLYLQGRLGANVVPPNPLDANFQHTIPGGGGGEDKEEEEKDKEKEVTKEKLYYVNKMKKARDNCKSLPHADTMNMIDQYFRVGRIPKKKWIKPKPTWHAPMRDFEEHVHTHYPAPGIEDYEDPDTGEAFHDTIERYQKMIGGPEAYYELSTLIAAHRLLNPRCANCGKKDADPIKHPTFKFCAICLLVGYCTKECAAEHYSRKGHKLVCIDKNKGKKKGEKLEPNVTNPYLPQFDDGYLAVMPKKLASGAWVLVYKNDSAIKNEQILEHLPRMQIEHVRATRRRV